MLDVKWVREHLKEAEDRLATRGDEISLDRFQELDVRRRDLLVRAEELKALRNRVTDEIGKIKKEKGDASEKIAEMRGVGDRIRELDKDVAVVDQELTALLMRIPNLPHETVPVGGGETENVEIRSWGERPGFSFEPQAHWDLGEALDILDFSRSAKIAGARFVLYRGLGALLERALINFMLDLHTREHGYLEVLPPFLANRRSFLGTGNLPKFENDLFKIDDTDFYLVPTAEVPVTNIHQDEIVLESQLPIRYAAYTPCFRKEAGAHGKDVRGLTRLHQFNKVELVKFCRPEDSYEELESLTRNGEEVLQRLGLPYRVVVLCTGDMGFSSAKTYDIEVWMPWQDTYREISSCSNFESFQARRAGIRYRPGDKGKARLVHTLNGSGLAVGRTVMAILENFQQADGCVRIPEVLRPYMQDREIIEKPC
jgi:seryl-tRNA synthetase